MVTPCKILKTPFLNSTATMIVTAHQDRALGSVPWGGGYFVAFRVFRGGGTVEGGLYPTPTECHVPYFLPQNRTVPYFLPQNGTHGSTTIASPRGMLVIRSHSIHTLYSCLICSWPLLFFLPCVAFLAWLGFALYHIDYGESDRSIIHRQLQHTTRNGGAYGP